MVYKDFRFLVALRVIILGLTLALLVNSLHQSIILTSVLLGIIVIIELLELFRFISRTNRKLTRFLESVKYSDFVSAFSADNELGKSFKDLNVAFNSVLEAFRKARSEKEEHLLYLNTIVEHVSTGLISYDTTGNVGLLNATAKKFLKEDNLRNIDELIEIQPRLYKTIFDLPTGKSTLFRFKGDIQLSIHATELILRGQKIRLVALQNIQSELQKKELEAWQNLTRVLRHEIMNSITPIASLTSTMKDILIEDLEESDDHFRLDTESVEDLQEGLGTIEGRSRGLIRFIDAYRDYTSIPSPKIQKININDLLEHICLLMKLEVRKAKIEVIKEVTPKNLSVDADEKLIEQVLINLFKNAVEAVQDVENPKIELLSHYNEVDDTIKIIIRDNGAGIVREAIDRIFIPFYTTKRTGSGIGLSLSRQIMQLHHGSLSVESELGEYTAFTLTF